MNLKKSIQIFGKTIPVWALATIALTGIASATLLTYYGQIVGTFNVQQSVTVDNGNSATDSMSGALGGETFCFAHSLKNQASVPAAVSLANTCSGSLYPYDCGGVSVSYNGVANGPFNSVEQPGTSGYPTGNWAHGTITVVDTGTAYQWTFTITDSAPHYGVGLVVSEDGVAPAFQVYFAEFGDHQWHYQPYGTGWNGVDTITLPSGISATGDGVSNTFTITIAKSVVGAPQWASQVRTTLLGVYPAWTPWSGPFVFQPIVGSALTNPITLQSGQTLDFNNCYQFAINTAPGTYTIITSANPA